jgi:signal peptidase I
VLRAVRWFGQLVGVVPPDERDLIKRVIAIGGQTVQCCDAQGRVQVSVTGPSGPFRSLNEPYVYRDGTDNWTPADKPGQPLHDPTDTRTFGPVTIPKGRLWVMGDHRNDSADSAYHWRMSPGNVNDSTVPSGRVIGKAVVIAWPPSRWRTLGTPATFTHTAALGAALSSAVGAAAPLSAGAVTVAPMWLLLRRRRRRSGLR